MDDKYHPNIIHLLYLPSGEKTSIKTFNKITRDCNFFLLLLERALYSNFRLAVLLCYSVRTFYYYVLRVCIGILLTLDMFLSNYNSEKSKC